MVKSGDLLKYDYDTPFILIDHCNIDKDFHTKSSSDYCYVIGKPGVEKLLINKIDKNVRISKKLIDTLFSMKADISIYKKRKKNLYLGLFSKGIQYTINTVPKNVIVYVPKQPKEISSSEFIIDSKMIVFTKPETNVFYTLYSYVSTSLRGYEIIKIKNLTSFKDRIKNIVKHMLNYTFKTKYQIREEYVVKVIPKTLSLYRNVFDIIKDARNTHKFIAHAGGIIGSYIHSNSLEALNNSYKQGFRLFELDIIKTKDNIFVAAHDWKRWKEITGYNYSTPVHRKEFLEHRIYGKYTPLDIDRINKWFATHKDAVLVTDKVNVPREFISQFRFKNRLIMELFSVRAVKEALKLNIKAMPSWNVIVAINKDIDLLKRWGVKYVAASRRVILDNYNFFMKLKKAGIKTYVFHINSDRGKNELFSLLNDMKVIYGIYADKWNFNIFKIFTKKTIRSL